MQVQVELVHAYLCVLLFLVGTILRATKLNNKTRTHICKTTFLVNLVSNIRFVFSGLCNSEYIVRQQRLEHGFEYTLVCCFFFLVHMYIVLVTIHGIP